MRKLLDVKKLTSFILLTFSILGAYGFQGIKFRNISFEEAKDLAKAHDKLIFVDFYADWCGPCRWMDNNVFGSSKIGKGYNYHFVSVKVDIDNDEPELVESVGITAIPTYGFFTPDGELIYQQIGSTDIPGFWELGKTMAQRKKLLENIDNIDLDDYENKNLVFSLIEYQDKAKGVKLAIDYIKNLVLRDDELYINYINPDEWELIEKYLDNPTDPLAMMIMENCKKILEGDFNLEQAAGYLEKTIEKLMDYMVDNGDTTYMDYYSKANMDYVNTLSEVDNPLGYYSQFSRLRYSVETGNNNYFMDNVDQWLETYHDGGGMKMHLALLLHENCVSKPCLQKSIDLTIDAIKEDDVEDKNYFLAHLYMESNQQEKAKPIVINALQRFIGGNYTDKFVEIKHKLNMW